jgi:hypothetical protein
MTIHQCPKCELRFDWKTELDDHCWHDHPEFRHEYPAQPARPPVADAADIADRAARRAQSLPQAPAHIDVVDGLLGWLVPARPADQAEIDYSPSTPRSQHSSA